jgi:hypothetical protein
MWFQVSTLLMILSVLAQKDWIAAAKSKPALNQFSFNTVLSTSPNYVVTLYWSVDNENTPTEDLSFALSIKTETSGWNYQWLAIGFGTSMLDAQFIVCHGMKDGKVVMHQHSSTRGYSTPVI